MKSIFKTLTILFFALAYHSFGGEVKYGSFNVAFTYPDDWNTVRPLPNMPGLLDQYTSPDKKRVLRLMAVPNKFGESVDDKTIAKFEQGIQNSSSGTKVWGRVINVAGVKCYERLGDIDISGIKFSSLSRLIETTDQTYCISALQLRFDGQADKDSQIRKAVESFRFLSPPKLAPNDVYSSGFKLGLLFGWIVTLAIVAAIVISATVEFRKNPEPGHDAK